MAYIPYSPDPSAQPKKKNRTVWIILGTAAAAVVATFAVILGIGWYFVDGPGAEPVEAADTTENYKFTGNPESVSTYYPFTPATAEDINTGANSVCNALESGLNGKEVILLGAEAGAIPGNYGKFVQAVQLEYCPQFGLVGTDDVKDAETEDIENRAPAQFQGNPDGTGAAICGLLRNGMDFNTMALNVAGNSGESIQDMRDYLTRVVNANCPNQPIR